MTSTTLTTAPVTKSVQHVPKKVRMRVPINTRVGVRDFFFAKRGLFGVQSRERFGVRFCEAIDRICVCIIDIVFVSGYLSATVGVVVVSFASTDQKTRAAAAFARARERERERESNSTYYTAFYNSRARQRRTKRGRKRPLVDDDVIEKHYFDTLDFLASFFFSRKRRRRPIMFHNALILGGPKNVVVMIIVISYHRQEEQRRAKQTRSAHKIF